MQVYLCTDKYMAGIENDVWNFLISKKSNMYCIVCTSSNRSKCHLKDIFKVSIISPLSKTIFHGITPLHGVKM